MKKRYFAIVVVIILAGNLIAQPGFEPDTIFVSPGWNLIGSKFSGAVADIVITEPPGILASPFYRFNSGNGYLAADSLEESSGYWVKVSNPQNGPGLTIIVIYPVVPGFDCGHPIWGRVYHGGFFGHYNSVQIGSQCWLKQNLRIGNMIDGCDPQIDNGVIEKYCYHNEEENCNNFGGLYQWDEAMQYVTTPAQGICPPGWRIPTAADFLILKTAVGDDGNSLKSIGEGTGAGAGTNTSKFSAFLAGYNLPCDFVGKGNVAKFWSSSQSGGSANYLQLYGTNNNIDLLNHLKTYALSIRCLKIN